MMRGRSVYVPPWGLPLTFSPAFAAAPAVSVSVRDSGKSASARDVTASGCTLIVADRAGRKTSGLVNWTAQ